LLNDIEYFDLWILSSFDLSTRLHWSHLPIGHLSDKCPIGDR